MREREGEMERYRETNKKRKKVIGFRILERKIKCRERGKERARKENIKRKERLEVRENETQMDMIHFEASSVLKAVDVTLSSSLILF